MKSYQFSMTPGRFESYLHSQPNVFLAINDEEDENSIGSLLYQFKKFLVDCGHDEDIIERIVIRREEV